MSISINKGGLNLLLVNSSRKIDVSVNSPALSETRYNMKFNKKYDLSIVMTKNVFNKLTSELQEYCRMIPEKNTALYAYDITYEKTYNENEAIDAERAFVERKKYALLLNEVRLNLEKIVRTDPDITYLRATNSKIFVKYYQLTFKKYINKKVGEAAEYIEEALKHRSNDKLTLKLKYNIEKAIGN
jgi:hypothetical protein